MSLKIPSILFMVLVVTGLAGLPGCAAGIDPELPPIPTTQPDNLSAAEREALAQELFSEITSNIDESAENTASDFALELALAGRLDWAGQLFEQAVKQQKSSEEGLTAELLIKMTQAGLSDRALELVDEINAGPYRTGLERSWALNAVAQAFIDAGRRDEARHIIQQAVELAQAANHYSLSYSANGSCGNEQFSALIAISETLSQLEFASALEIADSIRSCSGMADEFNFANYRGWAYQGIVQRLDNPQQITQVWQATQTQLDTFERADVWKEIAIAYWQQGQLEQFKEVITAIGLIQTADDYWNNELLKFKLGIFIELAEYPMEANDTNSVKYLQQRVQANLPKVRSLDNVDRTAESIFLKFSQGAWAIAQAEYLDNQGETTQAMAILTKAWANLPDVADPDINAVQLNLINASLALGEIEQALIWFESLQDRPVESDACQTEKKSSNRAAKIRLARCRQAYSLVRQVGYFSELSDPHLKQPQFYHFLAMLLQDFEQTNYQEPPKSQSNIPEQIGLQFIRLGDVKRGLALIQEHTDDIDDAVIEALITQQQYQIVHSFILESASFDLENRQKLLLSLLTLGCA
ncbi:MAG: hypothetical protein AAGG51_19895 [Cyanobacteria bacterium P01_G01_bin.54]